MTLVYMTKYEKLIIFFVSDSIQIYYELKFERIHWLKGGTEGISYTTIKRFWPKDLFLKLYGGMDYHHISVSTKS